MGAFGEAFGAFVQPLIDQTDGSHEQLQKALSIGQLCFNAALLPDDERDELFDELRSSLGMEDEEFDDFRRSVLERMIARHEEMFPRMHGRDLTPVFERGSSLWPEPPTAPAKKYAGTDRYAPCPCGSGKKYKFCCGAPPRR
jgi:hypothetical protein